MQNVVKVVGIGIIIALLLLLGPLLFLWAINTLAEQGGATNFHIPFNFWTWLACVVLSVGMFGSKS